MVFTLAVSRTVRVKDLNAALNSEIGMTLSAADLQVLSKHLDSTGSGLVNYRIVSYVESE